MGKKGIKELTVELVFYRLFGTVSRMVFCINGSLCCGGSEVSLHDRSLVVVLDSGCTVFAQISLRPFQCCLRSNLKSLSIWNARYLKYA